MKYKQYKEFNLTCERPQAILVGNGINLIKNPKIDWNSLITKISVSHKELKNNSDNLPYTVKATAVCDTKDIDRQHKLYNELSNIKYSSNSIIRKILDVKADAFITTNYTYELENEIKEIYSALNDESKRKYACSTTSPDKKDTRFLLTSFNRFDYDEREVDIWHMHGEHRRKSSYVLTHDEYARLISEVMQKNKHFANKYVDYEDQIKMKSWLDYFIVADMYILGLGFDFSEFDLWWLLNRRQRENLSIDSKIFFYEPLKTENDKRVNQKCKFEILDRLGVEVKTFNFVANNDEDYAKFYELAIEDIKEKVGTRGVGR